MSPDAPGNSMTGERFDDDRLLAFALGLDDDPELRQALPADAQLHERLRRLESELGDVEAQVRAAVPPVDEEWSDLSAARWEGLRPYLRVPGPQPARARRRFGIRVLGPALAVAAAIALALGVTLSRGLLTGGGTAGSDRAGGGVSSLGTPSNAEGGSAYMTVQAATYRTIVVARAATAQGEEQRYDVLRVLKGSAPASVTLTTEVGGELPSGSLALLYLLPVDTLASCPPSAVPSPTATSGPTKQGSNDRLYLFQGSCAIVQPLPKGTQPEDVTLP